MMAGKKMSPDKSHLLAYLKHTEGFEQRVHSFIDLPISEILDIFKAEDEYAYLLCLVRFQQQGVNLLTAT